MSTPNFLWLGVPALCTETQTYNTHQHHGTTQCSNTSEASEGNSVPSAGRAARIHGTAEDVPRFPVPVLKNLDIYISGRSKITAGHVLYEPHTFEKDV